MTMSRSIKPESDENRAAMNRLLAACTSLQRGETIPYSLMEKELDVKRGSGNWSSLCQKFHREFLKIRGIRLWAETNIGYRLLTQAEQAIENPQKRSRRAERQLTRGLKETELGGFDELSPQLQAARAHAIHYMHEDKLKLARDRRQMELATRKSDTPPTMLPPNQQGSNGNHK